MRVARKLNVAEREEADKVLSDQLRQALDRFGLAEYLSAGPYLIDRYENAWATGPAAGAALVRATIDWQRLRLVSPITAYVLRNL